MKLLYKFLIRCYLVILVIVRVSNRDGTTISPKAFIFYRNVKYKKIYFILIFPIRRRTTTLETSGLNPPSTTSSSLFVSWIRQEAPRKWTDASFRADIALLSRFLLVSPPCRIYFARESCPAKTDSQNLLISRVPPGETGKEAMTAPGKSASLRIRKLQVHANAKFHRAILLLFLKRFPRIGGPRTEGRGDIAWSYLGFLPSTLCKNRTLIPESFVRSFRSTYRSTILVLLYANLQLFLNIFVTRISRGNN